ncbi:uncharacterized protein [Dendrobates tinctorius]|uniref:uncharacterized protein n=1 Tax=Dendrobates tinctorius TaxID=92724 RepID=UPI003CCA67FD
MLDRTVNSSSVVEAEQEQQAQGRVARRRVTEREEDVIDNDLLITLVQERVPLWDTRVQQHSDNVAIWRLWNEVAREMLDGWDKAPQQVCKAFRKYFNLVCCSSDLGRDHTTVCDAINSCEFLASHTVECSQLKVHCLKISSFFTLHKVTTHWRSMKDHFNKDLCIESQAKSGSGARMLKYKYHSMLAFFRPFLAQIITWSSTLEPGSGAVLHRTATDPSQPSISEAASGPSTQTGDLEAGPSGVPLSQASSAYFYVGSSRHRQKASDRTLMLEFMHLSLIFHDGLKALGDRLDSGLSHIKTLIQDVTQSLDHLKADQRPAHHFFNQIQRGMSEHLIPDLQLSVMQACNAAYVQAMQQTRYLQQSVVAFPPVPILTRLTSMPRSVAYHCTATTIPSPAGHHYSVTTMPSAAVQSTATTVHSAAPAGTSSTTIDIPQQPDPGRTSTTSMQQQQQLEHGRPSTSTRPLQHQDTGRSPSSIMAPEETTPTLPRRQQHRTVDRDRRTQDKDRNKKKKLTITLPPPSPPNVSVMSGLSQPSSVSLFPIPQIPSLNSLTPLVSAPLPLQPLRCLYPVSCPSSTPPS